jgi:ribonuclease-3
MRAEPATLESKLNYQFTNAELLRRALTHSSLANESRTGPGSTLSDNEQLEFLGDSILGFLISDELVRRFPSCREGELSGRKAHLVSADHLHGVARRLDVGSYLELGRGEEMSGGRGKKNLLVDALEAIIAAIYLDGGLEAARNLVAGLVLDAPVSGDGEEDFGTQATVTNFKLALLELAQSRNLPEPHYAVVGEKGPQHSKTFTVEVQVGKDCSGQAEGRTKKVAAQRAARGVYEKLLAARQAHPPPP